MAQACEVRVMDAPQDQDGQEDRRLLQERLDTLQWEKKQLTESGQADRAVLLTELEACKNQTRSSAIEAEARLADYEIRHSLARVRNYLSMQMEVNKTCQISTYLKLEAMRENVLVA